MECTKCKKKLDLSFFSYKDIYNKIFYLHCDICRQKQDNNKKKLYENMTYLEKKENNIINCNCGKKFVAFRNYHILRHENTLFHIKNISN
tara:strand:- start:181 stop:450 length:270 start_codon:yes stop_codon:yes gene_type:complete